MIATVAKSTVEEMTADLEDLCRRAGRLTVRVAGEPWPVAAGHGLGFLYVLEFDDGLIKVGRTESPDRRLAEHRADARRFGRRIVRGWCSPPISCALAAEREVKCNLGRIGWARAGTEYFEGVNVGEAVYWSMYAYGDRPWDLEQSESDA